MPAAAPYQGRHLRMLDGSTAGWVPSKEDFPVPDNDPIGAPGVAAWLRQHPQRVRQGGAAAIVFGVVLFVVASLTTNAGARSSPPAAAPAAVSTADTTTVSVYDSMFDAASVTSVDQQALGTPVHVKKQAPADKKVISGLAANGIPNVALNAYRVASARMANVEPSCGIDWALLAGIGRVESDHGRFAGAVLHSDGVSTPRIIGIPLNGNGTALITDTDGGRLDGDTVYDRAVGPMQFIPSTWAAYGTDATADGTADPFNINDAALTSARYLCAAGGDLRTHSGQVAAILAYNYSDEYLAQVLALANAYRTGIPVSGVPVGNTTGGLPPVGSGGYVPPANPGAPTAIGSTSSSSTTSSPSNATTTSSTSGTSTGSTSTGSTSAGSTPTGSTSTGSTSTSSSSPTGGTSGSTTAPAPATSATSTPTATKTCLLWDLLNPTHCLLYG
jgi:membrane-bound lytic murein transglycosylase B